MKKTALKRGTKGLSRGTTSLRRTGFKRKDINTLLEKKRASTGQNKPSKTISKGWTPPKWFMAIDTGSHGSNPVQKRLWKLTSDYVRINDFYTFGNKCVSCHRQLESWRDGDCGHYKTWGASNAYAKYNLENLAIQCKKCNHNGGGDIGYAFGLELKRRHGDDILERIEIEDQRHRGAKMENIILVQIAEVLVKSIYDLPEKPDYWEKLIERYENKD